MEMSKKILQQTDNMLWNMKRTTNPTKPTSTCENNETGKQDGLTYPKLIHIPKIEGNNDATKNEQLTYPSLTQIPNAQENIGTREKTRWVDIP